MTECYNCGQDTVNTEECLACGAVLCIPCADDHVCTLPSQYEREDKWEKLREW